MPSTNDKLTVEDVEAAIRHEDRRNRSSHVYKQLLDTMRENERLRNEMESYSKKITLISQDLRRDFDKMRSILQSDKDSVTPPQNPVGHLETLPMPENVKIAVQLSSTKHPSKE